MFSVVFFIKFSLSLHLERCMKHSLVETQTFEITPTYFCPAANVSLNIRVKIPSNVTRMYSELRFEARNVPKMRYLIDYCGNGTKGCIPDKGVLKYKRKFPPPTKVVTNSEERGYFDIPITVRLIHHGLVGDQFIHVGCLNYTTKRQLRC